MKEEGDGALRLHVGGTHVGGQGPFTGNSTPAPCPPPLSQHLDRLNIKPPEDIHKEPG